MSDAVKKADRKKMHPDTVLVFAQIALTVILLSAIIGMLAALFFLKSALSAGTQSTATNIILVLTTLLTLSWNYFFARQRPSDLPDPNPPTGANHAPIPTGGTVTVAGNDSRSAGH